MVVIAGGMYAAEIGRMAGVRIPVIPMSHQYLITEPFRERGEDHLPTLRDPDLLIYFREEGQGLVMGGYERQSKPAFLPHGTSGLDQIPPDFNGRLLEDDWDRFAEITENSKRRVPVMDEVGIMRLINGPEGFTPDNEFCLGETEVAGLFVGACFCAHGLAGAGGVGKVMAEWITDGEPSLDLWEMDIRRFGSQYRSPAYTHARIKETYETYYDILYPNHEREAGRPLRVSPANAWHREHGAAFGEKSGWERVNWYESNAAAGTSPSARGAGRASTGRRRSAPSTGRRARAWRSSTRPPSRRWRSRGPGRQSWSSASATTGWRGRSGKLTYTQMLNPRGGIECDFTVGRLAEDRFSIVTGTAFGNHDREWIRKHLPADGSVQVHDTTSQWACFGIWGPLTREVLQPLTPQSLSNEDFPYMNLREITVGKVPVRALRVTYVGELGWELVLPEEYGIGLWTTLWEAGQPHGIVAGGYRAIDSMRLEKGYRVWGADITPDETPYEGGVGFSVKLDKEGGFIGRDALAEAKERGPRTKLCCLLLEDPRSVALGNEPVRIDGEIRGRVTTGGYGYTVERSIAYAYLPPEHGRARDRRRRRDLRPLDRGRGRRRAALRSQGRADQGLGRIPRRSRRSRRSSPRIPAACG